jgi:hypothetical protein
VDQIARQLAHHPNVPCGRAPIDIRIRAALLDVSQRSVSFGAHSNAAAPQTKAERIRAGILSYPEKLDDINKVAVANGTACRPISVNAVANCNSRRNCAGQRHCAVVVEIQRFWVHTPQIVRWHRPRSREPTMLASCYGRTAPAFVSGSLARQAPRGRSPCSLLTDFVGARSLA